jgi:DNA-directed RNA polymerase subunit RPC12/RpoP
MWNTGKIARWNKLIRDDLDYAYYACSRCGRDISAFKGVVFPRGKALTVYEQYPLCPECGATMSKRYVKSLKIIKKVTKDEDAPLIIFTEKEYEFLKEMSDEYELPIHDFLMLAALSYEKEDMN